jgi:hypothetical protein
LTRRTCFTNDQDSASVVGARGSGPEFAEATELTAEAMPSARVAWVECGRLIDTAHPAVLAFVDDVLAEVVVT